MSRLYKAYTVVTGNIDERPFRRRLHEYIAAGYIVPVDKKYKVFRVEEKLVSI